MSTILTPGQIKHLQTFLINDRLMLQPLRKTGVIHDECFHFYVGHDPYNSADNQAFMQRIEDRA